MYKYILLKGHYILKCINQISYILHHDSYFTLQILDSIGVFLLCSIKEAQHHKNMLVFSVQHDISSFTRLS